jgi:hypothetical protein
MTKTQPKIRFGSLAWWQQQEREQIKWIESCGGSLSGYVANYGDPNRPRANGRAMAGNGGTAIYNADMAELHKIQAIIREKFRRKDKEIYDF